MIAADTPGLFLVRLRRSVLLTRGPEYRHVPEARRLVVRAILSDVRQVEAFRQTDATAEARRVVNGARLWGLLGGEQGVA